MDVLFSKLPRMPNCCFCISVDTGSLIIGYLQLIGSLINFITSCVALSWLANFDTSKSSSDTKSAINTLYGIYIFDVLLQCFFLIIALMLVMGVHKKNPRFVSIWLIAMVVLIPLKLISAILIISYGAIGSFFGFLISILIQVYFVLVVNTVYQDYEAGGAVNY